MTAEIRSNIYHQRYLSFINSCKNKHQSGYTEIHHIIPRCIGGTNDESNLIVLTARQHYIAHWMLWKAFKTSKLVYAFFMMYSSSVTQQRYSPKSSRIYERLKIQLSTLLKETKVICVHCGTSASPSRHKLYHGDNCLYNPTLTPERILEIKQIRSNIGNNGNKRASETVTCPHCGKTGGNGAMRRKHFDNCLSNPEMSENRRNELLLTEERRNSKQSATKKSLDMHPDPTTAGKKLVNKCGVAKYVNPDEIERMIEDGWCLGGLKRSKGGTRFNDAKLAEVSDRVSM